MADRIIGEQLLNEVLMCIVTATHDRPYVEVNRLITMINGLPLAPASILPPEPPDPNGDKT